jgi:hypothetical protein
MVSVLAHLLLGSSLYFIIYFRKPSLISYLFCLFVSILPDFDYIIYLFHPIGDSGLYHRVYFHNIFAFAFFAFLIFLINIKNKQKYPILGSFIIFYGFHIILDLFDNGVPLLFPFSSRFFLIAQIGTYVDLPWKLVYEGNIYFSFFAILLYMLSLSGFLLYLKWKRRSLIT